MLPFDYCENEKKKPLRRPPKSECAKIKEKIKINVERIANLKKAISLHNRLIDKTSIDDVDEIDDLLDGSDDEMPPSTDIIRAGSSMQGENDESIVIVSENMMYDDAPIAITTGIALVKVDNEFSVEYCYTSDVSYLLYQ